MSLCEKIYKVSDSITKEEILDICEFEDYLRDVNEMTYAHFVELSDNKTIMDYDGFADLILSNKFVSNAHICVDGQYVYFENKLFVPLANMYFIFGDEIKFAWYNN